MIRVKVHKVRPVTLAECFRYAVGLRWEWRCPVCSWPCGEVVLSHRQAIRDATRHARTPQHTAAAVLALQAVAR